VVTGLDFGLTGLVVRTVPSGVVNVTVASLASSAVQSLRWTMPWYRILLFRHYGMKSADRSRKPMLYPLSYEGRAQGREFAARNLPRHCCIEGDRHVSG
jgi:hypothetical protein